ncbi:mitochondrial import inner membrane translocase subunit TIM50-B [Drosophila persimilis]|uniref:mitochondrial import inner membrane translocase subunit TIM50-B n=1 Tax=Drosophila persimilis TaxID=7234 RepID=UPI000F07C71E|nr:mitochondrial import inner membrane translocase subunit TIM50-B [Drosophila persimilis]
MTLRAIARLHCRRARFGRRSRLLTSGAVPTMVDATGSTAQEGGQNQSQDQSQSQSCRIIFGISMDRPSSLVSSAHRRYSTFEKTHTEILSKLFPQTSIQPQDEESQRRQKREEEEEKAEFERAWRRMKLGLSAFGMGGLLFSFWAIYFFGKPPLDEEGNVADDEFSKLPEIQQYIGRTWRTVNRFTQFIQEPSSQKLLPDELLAPYVQPPYTLVLEVKDVLIHPDWTYKTGWRFKKRPGVDLFLSECAKYFEIVIYTAEQGITVFPLLDALDPNGYIMYRLVRDSTHFVDGHHVKNLDNLNRDLKRVVVVDWDKNSTKLHPKNTFSIPRWSGNDDDTALFDLVSFLTVLGISEIEDVREVLQYYSQFKDPVAKFRENQQKLSEKMMAEELKKSSKPQPMVRNWTRRFFNS